MTKYGVLLGYGLFDGKNAKYRGYLDAFAALAKEQRFDRVVLCGGKTSPGRPYDSESGTARSYLEGKLKGKVIEIEDRSFTTAQNIRFAKKFLGFGRKDQITIFCDNVRPFKTMWYVMHYWYGLRRGQIQDYFVNFALPFYRKHYTTEEIGNAYSANLEYKGVTIVPYRMRERIEDAVGQIPASVLEIIALYDKSLETKLMRSTRIKFGFRR